MLLQQIIADDVMETLSSMLW